MRLRRHFVAVLGFFIAVLPAIVGAQPAEILVPADKAFQNAWEVVDAPVASGQVTRTWTYGPYPIGVARESYVESTAPGKLRLVQYWDKARMELTHPDTGQVTNGLLVVEMVTGRIQAGDSYFDDLLPASVPVAGDLNSETSPTYASFTSLTAPYTGADRDSQVISEWIDRDGTVIEKDVPEPILYGNYQGSTGHYVADVFWDFMQTSDIFGSVNPLLVVGFPIVEPYWTEVPIAGTQQLVLVQCFERRCLTYNRSNDPSWQVEWGNVGAAYMRWAKPDFPFGLALSPDGTKVAYVASPWGNNDIQLVTDNGEVRSVSRSPYDETRPLWSSDSVVFYNGYDQGYPLTQVVDVSSKSNPTTPRNGWYNATPSPNGERIAYNGEGGALRVAMGNEKVGALVPAAGDATYSPVWGDGTTLAFISYNVDRGLEQLRVWRIGDPESVSVDDVGLIRDFALSSDGKSIAVIDIDSNLWVGPVTGLLKDSGLVATEVAASPVDDTLFFAGEDRNVWSVNFGGDNQLTQLTTTVVADLDITVSGQGDRIAFRRITLDGDQIVLLNLASMQESVLVRFD